VLDYYWKLLLQDPRNARVCISFFGVAASQKPQPFRESSRGRRYHSGPLAATTQITLRRLEPKLSLLSLHLYSFDRSSGHYLYHILYPYCLVFVGSYFVLRLCLTQRSKSPITPFTSDNVSPEYELLKRTPFITLRSELEIQLGSLKDKLF
jgi:hypothetical protein